MVIQHNMSAMNGNRMYGINNRKKASVTEKLSSGYRINRAADDAAGLSISEKMRRQIRGLNKGRENIQDGISWVQIGDGAMEEVNDMIHRMVELSVKASTDTITDEERGMIDQEMKHLKTEINRIGTSTKFNDKNIFLNPEVSLAVQGVAGDLNIFNATYDDQTGEIVYGGFTFRGNRIPWDTVNPDMVYQDANTGEQLFREGVYTYTDSSNNTFKIEIEDGAKVPEITQIMDISASSSGITVGGKTYSWNKFLDENGKPATAGNIHEGMWSLEHEGATITYNFFQPITHIDDMIRGINANHDGAYKYTWEQPYAGPKEEQAVDIVKSDDVQITNDFKNNLVDKKTTYTIKADETGIWLNDYNGTKIDASFRSWDDMGIASWEEGDDIKSDIEYKYTDTDGTADTYVSFSFKLSDVTSVDSVIDGLDGVTVTGNNYKSNYEAESNVGNIISNVHNFNALFIGKMSFDEEIEFGRNFDDKIIEDISSSSVSYNEGAGTTQLVFNNSGGDTVLTFNGTTDKSENEFLKDMNPYIEDVIRAKQNALLAGKNPDDVNIGTPNLTGIVGVDKITTSGYFDDTVTMSDAMNKSDGNGNSYKPGVTGKVYPTSFIDFSGLDSNAYTLDSLLEAGFNTTCKTCNNHYSIKFVNSISGGAATTEGYGYKKTTQGSNYILEIDLTSLKTNGVDTGKELADAIVSITKEAYDFHYTQYAAEGSKLYIYDNRAQDTGTRDATFNTYPHGAVDVTELSFELKSYDKSIKLEYSYNFGDAKDSVKVEMVANNTNGKYVEVTDALGNKTYEEYDSNKHSSTAPRFDMTTSYKLSDGSYTADKNIFKQNYVDKSIKELLNNTTVDFNTTDYSFFSFSANEKNSVAIRSLFDSEIVEEKLRGIIIQCSSNSIDKIEIPQFALNTMDLKIYNASTKTKEAAEATIGMTKEALQRLSEKRATFGSLQNRLEHAYNSNFNTEENTTAAESRIRDMDMAKGMVSLSNLNILAQAGQAMLAQANQMNQGVLSLLS